MNKYRYYNGTAELHETVLSDVVPTECLNGTDTFNASSLVRINGIVLVNDGTPVHQEATLGAYKQLRYNEIDGRTGELISAGYVYATKTFSLSSNAQTNILALDATRDDPAITYPITYTTLDDLDTYDITDATDMHSMYLTALATKKTHLDSGSALKTSIRDAVDRAAVDLIIDNR
jgi:putative salt-induced outer membrane protein YdiY